MYCSMVALTMGVQEIFQQVVFNCPCKRHFEYGLAFLCGPAILLFFLGIFLDDTLCRTGPERDTEKAMRSPVCHYFKSLFTIFYAMTLASVAPVAWLVLSFLQQQYYTCAYFGPPLAHRVSTTTNATDRCHFKLGFRSKDMEETYKTNSQIAGWSLMIIFVLVLVVSICISQCMKKGKRLKIPSPEYYHYVAAQEAVEQYHAIALERVKQQARMDIRKFFHEKKKNELWRCLFLFERRWRWSSQCIQWVFRHTTDEATKYLRWLPSHSHWSSRWTKKNTPWNGALLQWWRSATNITCPNWSIGEPQRSTIDKDRRLIVKILLTWA